MSFSMMSFRRPLEGCSTSKEEQEVEGVTAELSVEIDDSSVKEDVDSLFKQRCEPSDVENSESECVKEPKVSMLESV